MLHAVSESLDKTWLYIFVDFSNFSRTFFVHLCFAIRSGIWENCRAAYEDIVKHLER